MLLNKMAIKRPTMCYILLHTISAADQFQMFLARLMLMLFFLLTHQMILKSNLKQTFLVKYSHH